LLLEKNKVFALPQNFIDLFEMMPELKEPPASIENRLQSVFLVYSNCVGDIIHYYLQKTQFSALEGLKGGNLSIYKIIPERPSIFSKNTKNKKNPKNQHPLGKPSESFQKVLLFLLLTLVSIKKGEGGVVLPWLQSHNCGSTLTAVYRKFTAVRSSIISE
jgi:hypothetical protein